MTTLNVQPLNAPTSPKKTRTVSQCLKLMSDILKGCGFEGAWKLKFDKQVGGRCRKRFDAVEANGKTVRLRIKPGDNSTRWLCHLVPPNTVTSRDLLKELRNVREDGTVPKDKAEKAPPTPVSAPPQMTSVPPEIGEMTKKLGLPHPPIHIGHDVYAWIYTIAPEMAHDWLDKFNNKAPDWKNRRKSSATETMLRGDISRGLWRLTHQAIAFDPDLNLIDGQTRLEAGFSEWAHLEIPVMLNIPSESRIAFDVGRKRTPKQAGDIGGVNLGPDSKVAARGMAALRIFISGMTDLKSQSHSHQVKFVYREKYHHAYDWVMEKLQTFGPVPRVSTAPVLAAIMRAYYHVDPERLGQFMEILLTNVCSRDEDNAPIVLGKQLQRLSTRHADVVSSYGKTTRAIAAFEEEVPMTRLIADKTERFPLPDSPDEAIWRREQLAAKGQPTDESVADEPNAE